MVCIKPPQGAQVGAGGGGGNPEQVGGRKTLSVACPGPGWGERGAEEFASLHVHSFSGAGGSDKSRFCGGNVIFANESLAPVSCPLVSALIILFLF